MTMFIKILLIVLIGLYFSACAPKGSDSSLPITNAIVPDEVPEEPTTDGGKVPEVEPVIQPIVMPQTGIPTSVTYYKLTQTFAPVTNWIYKTYTATGFCTVIQTKTYCWDDGLKIIPSWKSNNVTYGPYGNTYWRMRNQDSVEPYKYCINSCTSDFMQVPRDMAYRSLYQNILSKSGGVTYAQVFSNGIATTESCLENAGKVSCPSFEIVLEQ